MTKPKQVKKKFSKRELLKDMVAKENELRCQGDEIISGRSAVAESIKELIAQIIVAEEMLREGTWYVQWNDGGDVWLIGYAHMFPSLTKFMEGREPNWGWTPINLSGAEMQEHDGEITIRFGNEYEYYIASWIQDHRMKVESASLLEKRDALVKAVNRLNAIHENVSGRREEG